MHLNKMVLTGLTPCQKVEAVIYQAQVQSNFRHLVPNLRLSIQKSHNRLKLDY